MAVIGATHFLGIVGTLGAPFAAFICGLHVHAYMQLANRRLLTTTERRAKDEHYTDAWIAFTLAVLFAIFGVIWT